MCSQSLTLFRNEVGHATPEEQSDAKKISLAVIRLSQRQKVLKQNSTAFQESVAVGLLYLVEIRISITNKKKKQSLTFVWDKRWWKTFTHSFCSEILYNYSSYTNSVRLEFFCTLIPLPFKLGFCFDFKPGHKYLEFSGWKFWIG